MASFNSTVDGDCVATYLREKQSIQKVLEGMAGRVCLTLDLWTSPQGIGYVFVSGQFLDSDWKMHRKLLNVIREPHPDSDTALSHSVAACLSDWGLDWKLFSVTINQTDLNDAAVDNVRALLFSANKNRLLVGNCLARSLSSIVQDVLFSVQGIVKRVRDSVEYVKASKDEYFMELKQHLSIDNQTQWNTTYEMLLAASKFKEVLSCLNTYDPNYMGAPSLEDWKQIETLCTYLKPLFDTANLLTTATAPTTNTFFHEAWKIHLELARAAASEDPFVCTLTRSMLENFNKYWKSSCFILAAAVVMDPRFKMKLVEFGFLQIYGDNEVGREYVTVVDDGIREIFHEYLALTPPANVEEANGQLMELEENQGLGNGLGLTELDAYIMMTLSKPWKTELDQYLEESLLPRVHVFDVVRWWKVNRTKYPTLSKMACDILSIPVCTVPVGSVFDTAARKEMDSRRCMLRPETVEALMCAMDWLHI